MHPLGCFGSSLAYQPHTKVCQGCASQGDCAALVESRRPQVLRLLSRFSDSRGETMAFHWLNDSERKVILERRRRAAAAEVVVAVYGSEAAGAALRAKIVKRGQVLFDKMTRRRINCLESELSKLAAFSKAMKVTIDCLSQQPHTVSEIADALVSHANYTPKTAEREAYALVSILVASDRAKRVGLSVELS